MIVGPNNFREEFPATGGHERHWHEVQKMANGNIDPVFCPRSGYVVTGRNWDFLDEVVDMTSGKSWKFSPSTKIERENQFNSRNHSINDSESDHDDDEENGGDRSPDYVVEEGSESDHNSEMEDEAAGEGASHK